MIANATTYSVVEDIPVPSLSNHLVGIGVIVICIAILVYWYYKAKK